MLVFCFGGFRSAERGEDTEGVSPRSFIFVSFVGFNPLSVRITYYTEEKDSANAIEERSFDSCDELQKWINELRKEETVLVAWDLGRLRVK